MADESFGSAFLPVEECRRGHRADSSGGMTRAGQALPLCLLVLLALAVGAHAESAVEDIPQWLQGIPREPVQRMVNISASPTPAPAPSPSTNETEPAATPATSVLATYSYAEPYVSYFAYDDYGSYGAYASYTTGASSGSPAYTPDMLTPDMLTPDMEYYSPGADDSDEGNGAAQFVYLVLGLVVVLGGFAIVVIIAYFYEKNEEESSFF